MTCGLFAQIYEVRNPNFTENIWLLLTYICHTNCCDSKVITILQEQEQKISPVLGLYIHVVFIYLIVAPCIYYDLEYDC
uniref:Putative ovule protein n=1 Tax=Solanum chacoense TaxID=4108 RepID=A0A0V0GMI5_SOLCH